MDNLFFRLAVVLVLAFIGFEAFKELRRKDKDALQEETRLLLMGRNEWPEGAPFSDVTDKQIETEMKQKPRNAAVLLTYSIVLATGIGFIVLKWVLPAVGDKVGEAFYSSGEKVGPDRNAKAMTLLNSGKYEEAIEEFQKLAEENPTDRFPVVEIAKIQQEKLEDVDAAIGTYYDALQKEWAEDDAAFFLLRLGDLYFTNKGDNATAKTYLNEVQTRYPGSRHAGMATHKLREIEEAEFIAQHGGAHH